MKKLQQFNILAFTFDRLKNSDFNINITPLQADLNEELISLADNECLRAIRRITDHPFDTLGELKLEGLFSDRKKLTKQKNSTENRKKIAEINNSIRNLLFIPEYVCVTFPSRIKKSDYEKINKNGFVINNVKYKWLLCGASHQRTNRAFYCSENIFESLYEILNCGAKNIPMLLPKYNAYIALSSSASSVVSTPNVCVVPDCEIKMTKMVDWVEQVGNSDYSITRVPKELNFNLFDGMGIISPRLAEKWASELDINYIPSCWGIRSAFVKGMVCVMDFHQFAREVAKADTITDLYGNIVDVESVDMIITQSQFKLWSAYDSWQSYCELHSKYGWTWGITKVSPQKDVEWVPANYQYLQVLDLQDSDIKELCRETAEWFRRITDDESHSFKLLYLLGRLAKVGDPKIVWEKLQDHAIKALMLNKSLVKDEHLTTRIVGSIRKKIRQSFLGKIIIRGNYQTRISDPYALMEWIFKLPVKGLLAEDEDYIEYWNKKGVTQVVAMRSPLTWRSEAHILNLKNSENMRKWYRYLSSGIVYNVWGCDCMLEADADFDLDCTCTTNNEIFLKGVIK